MVEVGIVDWSNYVLAGVAAGGAGVGAYRWFRSAAIARKRRQAEYRSLWRDFYGSAALVDDHGVEYEPAHLGIERRINDLESAFYGHTSHPPGRRRADSA